jgi:hypothetical protein
MIAKTTYRAPAARQASGSAARLNPPEAPYGSQYHQPGAAAKYR